MSARNMGSERRPGRPIGTVRLTPEIELQILTYVEAGSFDYIAAEAAGIDDRTFRDWVARGEGRHPTRRRTPQLAAFARAVREARARARAGREIVVADRDPKFWLLHAARSKPGREGWSDPIDAATEEMDVPDLNQSPEELAETIRVLVEANVIDLTSCGDPACRCAHHGGTDERS